MEEILFAFAVFYIAYRVAAGVLQAIGGILLLLTLPALWLAHTASAAARSDSRRQRAATMEELRHLVLPPRGRLR
jgi:hypothetical protein